LQTDNTKIQFRWGEHSSDPVKRKLPLLIKRVGVVPPPHSKGITRGVSREKNPISKGEVGAEVLKATNLARRVAMGGQENKRGTGRGGTL